MHSSMGQHDGVSGMNGHGTMQSGMGSQNGMAGMAGNGTMTMDVSRHFIQQMIPHHEDAVTMSNLALTQADHPELKQLATTIKQTQSGEIQQMQAWYKQWYGTEVPPGSYTNMPSLDGKKPFDKAFIEEMVPHHEMALMMSNMALQSADRPELRTFLQNIITTQTAEIEKMRQWYQQWYGTPLPQSTGMSGHNMGMGAGMDHNMGNMNMTGANANRQAQVAANGAMVMPFDLTKTTHMFTDTDTGGREVVTANDPADSQQIDLIRTHLKGLVPQFSSGDFSSPAAIHGDEMPGLAQLRAGYSKIQFTYEELPSGAALTYRTTDSVMVSVLHTWFTAQRTDHGTTHHTGP
jgi:uncharacterized protein (DUF305 family)